MGRLSTHVLDIADGRPAPGVVIEVIRIPVNGAAQVLKSVTTNSDGRTDAPLLTGPELIAGLYELRFHIADYFGARNPAANAGFFEIVPIRFRITDQDGHYHVPLLVSPWAYSTYRGS